MQVPQIRIRKIYYDEASRASVVPPYEPLDNRANPPFWFELWPILSYLESHELEEGVLHGFVSPKFPAKLGMTDAEVAAVAAANPEAEVLLFSYNWPVLVIYENAWLQGEQMHPGLIACSEDFLATQGPRPDLRALVSDLSSAVFSNYVVACPRYWRDWQALARAYVDYVEAGGPDLADCRATAHRGDSSIYQQRTFVQERLACWILAQGGYRVAHPDYIGRLPIPKLVPGTPEAPIRRAFRAAEFFKRRWRRSGSWIDRQGFRICRKLAKARYYARIDPRTLENPDALLGLEEPERG